MMMMIFCFSLDSGHVPGYALVNNIPYLELKNHHLLERAYSETQRHFYQVRLIFLPHKIIIRDLP